jgi:translation initiation factor 2B subunit (eIF-2B alpha/beta/delta family)
MGSSLIDGTPTCTQAFLEERIVYAAENIGKYVISTIRDNDVILTFGSSPLVRKVSSAIRSCFRKKILW